jgi:hypothetical protein
MVRRWRVFAGPILCAAGAFACNAGDLTLPEANQPAAVTVLQGNAQTAIAGGTLPESLVVRVTDSRKLPVAQIRGAFVLTPTPPTPTRMVARQHGGCWERGLELSRSPLVSWGTIS